MPFSPSLLANSTISTLKSILFIFLKLGFLIFICSISPGATWSFLIALTISSPDLITNFTKLLYATQEETIKNITTKGIQETPDSISRGTEKKIIEEIQSRASDYIKENSNYRTIGLHNREKYQSEILPSIVEQIIKKLGLSNNI